MIAHIKIGLLHIALHKEVLVTVEDNVAVKVVPSVFGSLLFIIIIAVSIILIAVYSVS